MAPEQRDKEETARVQRQRPILRVCAELALVGIIRDAPGRSGGEWIIRALRDLVSFVFYVRTWCAVLTTTTTDATEQLSNDPSLSSLPLLTTFLKSYARPFLGLTTPATSTKQVSAPSENGSLSSDTTALHHDQNGGGAFPVLADADEADELVEREIRERFKKMCEGYFESVAKKLVIEHKVHLPLPLPNFTVLRY